MSDLAVVQTRPLAEIPCEALKVASHFPAAGDPRLRNIIIKPGDNGDVVGLFACSATDLVQIHCRGFAEREIRLPITAVKWLLRRHPEAELVTIIEREVGILLRTFSSETTVAIGTMEGDAEVALEMPDMPPDTAGLELIYDRRLFGRIVTAFNGCRTLKFAPVSLGLRVETEGDGWSAVALVAGMTRPKDEEDPDQE